MQSFGCISRRFRVLYRRLFKKHSWASREKINMSHPFPPSFVIAESSLADAFFDEATNLGISHVEAEQLLRIIPASVRSAKAIKFVFGQDWRYLFGKEFDFDGNSSGFGVPYQAPLLVNLVRSAKVAERVLTGSQRRRWWQQLDMPAKHFDTILETLAVFNVAPDCHLEYEKSGLGVGSQKIDWLLRSKEGEFLLEVKNRPGQMAQEMTRMKAKSTSLPNDPIPDFFALFKSTKSKFLPIKDSTYTQGVILFLGIKVPATALENFYHHHLQSHFHFVALGKEDKEFGISVNLIASASEIADRVRSGFKWHEGADLIL
jgi:hypothetical protein